MKFYKTWVFFLAVLWTSCGKKFMNPNGNQSLAAEVTASPLTVASDSLVTITGQGFSTNVDLDKVFFNGVGAGVLQASTTQLVVKVPAAGSTGNITVRVNGEQANGPVFSYPSSSLFVMSPTSGIGGTIVALTTGVHVGSAASTTVRFGSLDAKVLYTDSGRIVVSAPDSVKTSQLTIQTNGQQYAGPVFTQTTITAISPNVQGAASGTVQIIGTGFNPIAGHNGVSFVVTPAKRLAGADTTVPAVIVSGSADTLVVQIPATAGTGTITVNPNNQNRITGPVFTLFSINGQNIRPDSFPYLMSSGVPILMMGSGFDPDVSKNHLTMNGLACQVRYVSPTRDSLVFYLPDVINPPSVGTANGPFVLQSGGATASTAGQQTVLYEEVSTLAGGTFGLANGKGKSAQFETLSGITWGRAAGSNTNYLYVTDKQANNIRRISTDGVVTLVAGSPTGEAGFSDGIGASALFNNPTGIAADNSGYLWVSDSGNFRIRVINLSTNQVTTVAGAGIPGTTDGSGSSATFLGPTGVTLISGYCGNCGLQASVAVTDAGGGTGSLRELDRAKDGTITVSTLQGGLIDPECPTSDQNYNYGGIGYVDNQALYEYNGFGLLAGSPGTAGFVNGASALFNNPQGALSLYVSNYNSVDYWWVCDAGNNVIRSIDLDVNPPYAAYTYIGGMGSNTAGYQDGGFRTALFNQPGAMVQANNRTYLIDVGNHAIREFN